MINPRYVRVSSDDVMWFYDYNPASAVQPGPFVDPEGWFDRYVFGARCSTPPKPYQIFRAKQTPPDGMVQFTGVCGTPLIIACGFPAGTIESFYQWRERRASSTAINSSEWAEFIREANQADMLQGNGTAIVISPAEFWSTFEARLAKQPERYGGIDFFFFQREKQVYVHLELGSDRSFSSEYFLNLALQTPDDQEAFAKWLTQGTEIPRKAYSIDEEGKAHELTNLSIANIQVRDASFQSVDLASTPICPEGCTYRACSILAASITTYDPSAGIAGFDMELVALKSYCVDSDGDPCA